MRTPHRLVFVLAALAAVAASASAATHGPVLDPVTGPPSTGAAPPLAGPEPGLTPIGFVSEPTFVVGLGMGLAAAALVGWLVFHGGAKFVTSENVLENGTRYGIYEYLRKHPGSHLRELASTLALSTTNALWHLRKLEDADLIRAQKVDGYKVFYPIDDGIEGKRRALANAALKKDNAKALLDHVANHPGTHQRELARELGVNHGTVRWHLRKMVNAGLLIQLRRDHATLYYLTELGGHIAAEAHAAPGPPPTVLAGAGGMAEA